MAFHWLPLADKDMIGTISARRLKSTPVGAAAILRQTCSEGPVRTVATGRSFRPDTAAGGYAGCRNGRPFPRESRYGERPLECRGVYPGVSGRVAQPPMTEDFRVEDGGGTRCPGPRVDFVDGSATAVEASPAGGVRGREPGCCAEPARRRYVYERLPGWLFEEMHGDAVRRAPASPNLPLAGRDTRAAACTGDELRTFDVATARDPFTCGEDGRALGGFPKGPKSRRALTGLAEIEAFRGTVDVRAPATWLGARRRTGTRPRGSPPRPLPPACDRPASPKSKFAAQSECDAGRARHERGGARGADRNGPGSAEGNLHCFSQGKTRCRERLAEPEPRRIGEKICERGANVRGPSAGRPVPFNLSGRRIRTFLQAHEASPFPLQKNVVGPFLQASGMPPNASRPSGCSGAGPWREARQAAGLLPAAGSSADVASGSAISGSSGNLRYVALQGRAARCRTRRDPRVRLATFAVTLRRWPLKFGGERSGIPGEGAGTLHSCTAVAQAGTADLVEMKFASRKAIPQRAVWASLPDVAASPRRRRDRLDGRRCLDISHPGDDGRGDGLAPCCKREEITMDDRERYYSYREVCELTTLSRTTIWRLRRDKLFPAPLKMPTGRLVWPARVVIAWMEGQRV